ncbi:MAG TPA: hypothetical protein VF703_13295 [Pyrinomonadaceae bacterium]|jgi:hypothetical protein
MKLRLLSATLFAAAVLLSAASFAITGGHAQAQEKRCLDPQEADRVLEQLGSERMKSY